MYKILKIFGALTPQSIHQCLSRDRNSMTKEFKSIKELEEYLKQREEESK